MSIIKANPPEVDYSRLLVSFLPRLPAWKLEYIACLNRYALFCI